MRISNQPGLRALVLALCAFWPLSCQTEDVPEPPATPTVNVILVSIDTLRPDHLGCYGYEVPTSPSLDRFCDDAVVFRQAIAQAPSTLHSHASMLSSLLPHHHQATWGGKTRLPEEALTLAEILQSAGYATAAFAGGGQMDRVFGLDQGFDLYDQPGQEHFLGTAQRGLEWLDRVSDRPFFLFLHTYEVHHPYTPDAEHLALVEDGYDGELPNEISIDLLREINRQERAIDARDLAHIERTYDGEIRSMDDGFGFLIAALQERGLYEGTLIVFTSDHGEEFGEHGVVGWHSHTLYDELLRVPLVIKLPDAVHAGVAVAQQVRSIDIAPTILAGVGLAVPEEFEGTDLARLVDENLAPGFVAISRMDRPPGRDISSIRTEQWKLYRTALFNLEDDPGEQWDAALTRRDVMQSLNETLSQAVSAREPLETEQVVPSESTLDELRALGYLQ
jgi:arylsulfatase A-like enzyme